MTLREPTALGELGALYYPYMRPPRRWLARTLLYVDVVGSIVQPGDEGLVFPRLQSSGAFRPCAVASLLENVSDAADLVQEVVDRVGSGRPALSSEPDLLLPRKLPQRISDSLVEAGLFRRHPEGFAATTPSAMPNLLAVIADRVMPDLSARHRVFWRPATDTTAAFESFFTSDEAESAIVLALPGLPQPRFATDDDLSEVVAFRELHRPELAAYRAQLDAIVGRIAADAESATDALDALTDELAEHARGIAAIKALPSAKEISSDLVISVGLGAGAGVVTGGPAGVVVGSVGTLQALWANRVKVKAAVVGRRQRRNFAHLNYLVAADKAGILQ
jgi:hypothetical protein